jgi:hypothetical protein
MRALVVGDSRTRSVSVTTARTGVAVGVACGRGVRVGNGVRVGRRVFAGVGVGAGVGVT